MSAPATRARIADSLGALPNPITLGPVDPERQDHPVTDETARDPVLGVAINTQGASAQQTDGRPEVDPPDAITRTARHALAMFVPPAPSQPTNLGVKAYFTGGASTPGGVSLATGDPQRGNTYRLMPEPFDSPLFTAVQGAEGGVNA